MFKLFFTSIVLFSFLSIIQCDLTNLHDFLNLLKQNSSKEYPIGFLSKANVDVVKRYLRGNIIHKTFDDKIDMLKAIDNETIIAGITTGRLAEDLEPRYHVFSSLIVSPQAMLLAPDYNEKSTPYGLNQTSSNDLFDALNAAIVDVQREDIDETLLTLTNRTDTVRVYSCQQEGQLPVPNRNETTGFLRDILLNKTKLLIGGIGPFDWGAHDGNYKLNVSNGFYPKLLDAIVGKLGKLKGPDEVVYGSDIKYERKFYNNSELLFRALLNGDVHATDVYLLIDAPYTGTNESCSKENPCRPRESCVNGFCSHPSRSRSLHFRSTCTTASRDAKFIAKRNSNIYKIESIVNIPTTTIANSTPKTRWIGFVLVFVALFGAIFLALLILVRRKKHFRIQHTLQGGFGKFARLREDNEIPVETMDEFEDHAVQSPRDNTNSTN